MPRMSARYGWDILALALARGLETLDAPDVAELHRTIYRDDVGNVRLAPAERDGLAGALKDFLARKGGPTPC